MKGYDRIIVYDCPECGDVNRSQPYEDKVQDTIKCHICGRDCMLVYTLIEVD